MTHLKIISNLKKLSTEKVTLIKIILDILFIFSSIYIAQSIINEKLTQYSLSLLFLSTLTCCIVVPTFYLFNIYSEFTRFLNTKYLLKILLGLFISFFIIYLISLSGFTKSIFRFLSFEQTVIYFFINSILLINIRIFIKIFFFSKTNHFKYNCAIYGAGTTGTKTFKKIKIENKYNISIFFDDDKNKIGRLIYGLEIYSLSNLNKLVKNYQIKKIFICMPSATSLKIEQIKKQLTQNNIEFEFIDTRIRNYVNYNNINTKFIKKGNFDDAFIINDNLKKEFNNKCVLVTGAGGTIGKEICLQLLKTNINKMIILDKNEYSLFKIRKEINSLNYSKIELLFILDDLLESSNIQTIFNIYKPNIIFHAAAYKHVDLVESNPVYSVYNNLKSLINILEYSKQLTQLKLIFISTDKAVNPINYMGKSKRLGEILVNSFGVYIKKNIYSSVRFGNVIGSSGSLIPIINEQIFNGGPVTITNKLAERYFMTIQDAVALTINSVEFCKNQQTYVLDMGEQIKIDTLIRKLISQNNLKIKENSKSDGDIEIIYTGLKKGEKLREELSFKKNLKITNNNKIYMEEETKFLNENDFANIKTDIEKIAKLSNVNMLNNFFKKYL